MDRILVDPQIHFGKPCIAGTRITVQSVLELLNEGLSFEAIIRDYYPDLQVEDIRACLRYAPRPCKGIEADPYETPNETVIEGIRQGLQEALTGQTIPRSEMWEGIDAE